MSETKSRSDWLILNDSFQIDDEVDGKQNRISRERKLRKIQKITEKDLKEDLKVCKEKKLHLRFFRIRTRMYFFLTKMKFSKIPKLVDFGYLMFLVKTVKSFFQTLNCKKKCGFRAGLE